MSDFCPQQIVVVDIDAEIRDKILVGDEYVLAFGGKQAMIENDEKRERWKDGWAEE